MINTKKLIKMVRKWQEKVALRRKIISFPRANAWVAEKGHFAVYTADKRRFTFPISYLSNAIVRELLEMSEEEFGLPTNGPIIFPCDSASMEYLVSMIQRDIDLETEKATVMSISGNRGSWSCSLQQQHTCHQLLVC